MGITVQFRGFGSYPRPQLAQLASEDPAVTRTQNWKTVRDREARSVQIRLYVLSSPYSCMLFKVE